jgi:hypothetical protein
VEFAPNTMAVPGAYAVVNGPPGEADQFAAVIEAAVPLVFQYCWAFASTHKCAKAKMIANGNTFAQRRLEDRGMACSLGIVWWQCQIGRVS